MKEWMANPFGLGQQQYPNDPGGLSPFPAKPWWEQAPAEGYGYTPQGLGAIDRGGQIAGDKITDAGANAANALNAAADAIMAAVSMLKGAVNANPLGPSIDGALSDQGR